MPTKIFTILGGYCPFGRGCEIDSPSCRKCEHFYRAGTGTFFWCKYPNGERPEIAPKIEQITPEKAQSTKKRGRPAKKAVKKPVNRKKTKK